MQLLKRAIAILEKDPKQIHVLNKFLVRYAPQLPKLGRPAEAEMMEARKKEIRATLAREKFGK